MWILDLLARVRQHIHIQSTFRFVGLCALTGAVVLGFMGWLADSEYRAKVRESHAAQAAPPTRTETGDATTSGAQSPAVTGDGNTIQYDQPSEPKKPKPKPPE